MATKTREDIKVKLEGITIPSNQTLKDLADSTLFLLDEGCINVWKRDILYKPESVVYFKKNFYELASKNQPFCSGISPDGDTKNWCKVGSVEDEDWFISSNCMYANPDILRVGIGTKTPEATLDLSRKGKGQFLVEPNADDPKVSLINLDPTCDKSKVEIAAKTRTIDINSDTEEGLRFTSEVTDEEKELSQIEIMRLRLAKNQKPRVGIGTADPKTHLHVEEANVGFVSINGGENSMPEVKVGNLTKPCNVNFVKMTLGESEAAFVTDGKGGFQFKQEKGDQTETLVTFSDQGNVGIGTKKPKAELEIASSNEMDGNIKSGFCNTFPFVQLLNFRQIESDGQNYSHHSIDDKWAVWMADAVGFSFKKGRALISDDQIANIKEGSTLMRIYNEGKVTIGKNRHKDAFELDVDGNIRANSIYLDTDRQNLDEDSIQELRSVLYDLCKLRPITFKWNNKSQSFGESERIGFIADEVKPIFPEVVKENINCTGEAVAYQNLVPVLVKAIQEQQSTILAQTKSIEELSCKIEALEARVCKLEG